MICVLWLRVNQIVKRIFYLFIIFIIIFIFNIIYLLLFYFIIIFIIFIYLLFYFNRTEISKIYQNS